MLKFLFYRNTTFEKPHIQVFHVILQFTFLYIISLKIFKGLIFFSKKLDFYSLGLWPSSAIALN